MVARGIRVLATEGGSGGSAGATNALRAGEETIIVCESKFVRIMNYAR